MTISVVIPAAARDDVEDTVEAVRHWLPGSRIVVVNDTARDLAALGFDPLVTILPAPTFAHPRVRGVWAKLLPALRWVLAHDDAPLVLRLDADAMLLRAGFGAAAMSAADRAPKAGLFGSFRVGSDGAPRDFSTARQALDRQMGWRGRRHPAARQQLRHWGQLAASQGYEHGEHALGAALVLRREMLLDWRESGWLEGPLAATPIPMPDDYLFALLTRAAGYGIADVGGPGDLLALRWRGLPASPQDLLRGTAYVTHSVRHWQGYDETEIRSAFRATRR